MKKIATLSLVYLLMQPMPADSRPGGISALGVRLGPARPSVYFEETFSIGANADLAGVLPGVRLCPYADFWRAGFVKNSTQDWNWRLFAVGLSALKPILLNNSKAVPYFGGGAGFNFNFCTVDDPTRAPNSSKTFDMDLSLHAIAGLELPLHSRLHGYVELKYALAGVVNYFGFWFGLKLGVNGE